MLLLLLLWISGCTPNDYLSKDRARLEPKDASSIPHHVEIEKMEIEGFTSFETKMPVDFLTEAIPAGEELVGVWTVEGYRYTEEEEVKEEETEQKVKVQETHEEEKKEAKAKEEKIGGYCYLNRLNDWGEFINQCFLAKRVAELEKFSFFITNRDANWAYRLDGLSTREILSKQEITEGKKPLAYNAEQFDKDAEYRKKFVNRFGMTLGQINEFWTKDAKSKDEAVPDGQTWVREIIVGSPEWEEYKAEVDRRFPEKYKTPEGEIRMGNLPLDDFSANAEEDPGFTSSARFVNAMTVPVLTAATFSGVAWPVIFGSGLASKAITTKWLDTDWKNYYGRAKIIRYQMAPTFRVVIAKYQALIKRHIKKQRELEKQLRQLSR